MKRSNLTHVHGRGTLHYGAVRFALSLTIAISMIGVFNEPAQACNVITHHVVSEQALEVLKADGYDELYQILKDYPGQLTAGSNFPDWANSPQLILGITQRLRNKYDNASRAFDNAIFFEQFQNNMIRAINESQNQEEKNKAWAFMYGMISHLEADKFFHCGKCFLNEAYTSGGWTHDVFPLTRENAIESNLDKFVSLQYEIEYRNGFPLTDEGRSNACLNWDFPAIPMKVAQDTYLDWNLKEIPLTDIHNIEDFIVLTSNAKVKESELLTGYNIMKSSCGFFISPWRGTIDLDLFNSKPTEWLFAHFFTYQPPNLTSPSKDDKHGGLTDLVHHVALKWELTWDITQNSWKPSTAYKITPAKKGSLYYEPVTITLQPVTAPFSEKELLSLNRIFTFYKVDDSAYSLYKEPIRISIEGFHQISYYTVYTHYDTIELNKYKDETEITINHINIPVKEDIKTITSTIDYAKIEDRLFPWKFEQNHTFIDQSEQFYQVKRGDSLSSISMAFNISLDKLLAANPQIDLPDIIFPGELIRISDFPRSETIPPFYHSPKESPENYKE